MELLDTLRRANNGSAVAKLGERSGLTQSETDAVLDAVLPEFSHRIERNTLSRGGLADLMDLMDTADYEALLNNPDMAGSEAVREQGKAVLSQVVGTKHGSRSIAARAARETGIPALTIERMMPEIATLSLGSLQQSTAARFGDIFSQLPSGNSGTQRNIGDQRPLPLPGELNSGGGWGNDWQPGQRIPRQDDGMFPDQGPAGMPPPPPEGGFSDQSPLPVPGGAPGGNWGSGNNQRRRGGGGFRDLSDILRRRGGRLPKRGGSAGGIVRDILGSALGFKKGGVLSWIVRLVLMRVAWPILRRMIFGR